MYLIGRGRHASEAYPRRPYASPAALYDTTLYATQFGADPTGATDSTAAINEFLLQTGLQGRKGRIPAGTYLISGTLYTHDTDSGNYFTGGIIEGDGRELTILKWAGAKDDGQPMMLWSRSKATLREIGFDGDYKATYGLVIQRAQTALIDVSVESTWTHGIAVANEWPSQGLVNGFNEECVIFKPRVDFCGVTEKQSITLVGTGLGGTFTLTFDGNTTGPIAWNASAATVAAALLAANPALDSPPTSQGGTGNNPFVVTGALATTMIVSLKGLAAGHHATMTMDTSLITGTITTAATALVQEGSVANGIHFFNKDDPEDNHDNGTLAIFEPACRQNSGSGISLCGPDIKVWGGHFEGNVVHGIEIASFQPSVGGFSITNMVHWPYFEGNYATGLYISTSTRDWLALGPGSQSFYEAAAGSDAALMPGVNASGGISVVQRGATGYRLQVGGVGAARVLGYDQTGANQIPVETDGAYDSFKSITQSADAALAINLQSGTSARANYLITLDANITSLSISGAGSGGFTLTFQFIRGAAAKTVTWPATFKWAGGVAPTLGTGAAGSRDIIVMQVISGVWYEISRNLAVA